MTMSYQFEIKTERGEIKTWCLVSSGFHPVNLATSVFSGSLVTNDSLYPVSLCERKILLLKVLYSFGMGYDNHTKSYIRIN